MRILALETSGTSGTVAVCQGQQLLAEYRLDPESRGTRTLAPAIRDALADVGWRPREVELVACTAGPGSFTGLRVGVTTAKTFAYAISAPVLGVNTLEVIAAQAEDQARAVSVAIDAYRGEVFSGALMRDDAAEWRWKRPAAIVGLDAWLAELAKEEIVMGPALEKYLDRLPPGTRVAPRECWAPRAATVGQLAARQFAAGRRDDLFQLVPLYMRRSAAEEKWSAQQ